MSKTLSNLRIQDAANYIGVSSKTLRRWDKKGKLVPLRSKGDQRYYSKKQLDLFLNKDRLNVVTPKAAVDSSSVFYKWLLASFLWIFIAFQGLAFQGRTLEEGSTLTNNLNSSPSVLSAETAITDGVFEKYTFTVNVPAEFSETVTFKKDIVAPNVVYSVNGKTGDVNVG